MIYAAKHLIRKYPRLTLLLFGLWMAASPWLLISFVIQAQLWGILPAGLNEFLNGLGRRSELPFTIVYFTGLGLAAIAIGWMVVRLVAYTFRRFPI